MVLWKSPVYNIGNNSNGNMNTVPSRSWKAVEENRFFMWKKTHKTMLSLPIAKNSVPHAWNRAILLAQESGKKCCLLAPLRMKRRQDHAADSSLLSAPAPLAYRTTELSWQTGIVQHLYSSMGWGAMIVAPEAQSVLELSLRQTELHTSCTV